MEIEGKKEDGCVEVCDDPVRDDRDRQRACWFYGTKADAAGFIIPYVCTEKSTSFVTANLVKVLKIWLNATSLGVLKGGFMKRGAGILTGRALGYLEIAVNQKNQRCKQVIKLS